MNSPPIITVISPSITPGIPAFISIARLIPHPRPKAKNGIITPPAFDKNSFISSSRFPSKAPKRIGITAPISIEKGIAATPALPRAIIVRNGPSFKETIAIAPVSVASPNSPVRAA